MDQSGSSTPTPIHKAQPGAWGTAHADHVGGRQEQQDRVVVLAKNGAVLLVVADGIGGHKGGGRAAETVVVAATAGWARLPPPWPEPTGMLAAIRDDAHDRIRAIADSEGINPGSTCVLFYADASRATWIHVGDSRLYHFRDDVLIVRTRDHSMTQVLLEMGKIAEEEMATHPDQSRLLSALGGDDPPKEAEDGITVEPGDAFLLCSDGLWEQISTTEMAQALAALDLQVAVDEMVRTAVDRGGADGDNVSLAVARLAGGGKPGTGTGFLEASVKKAGSLLRRAVTETVGIVARPGPAMGDARDATRSDEGGDHKKRRPKTEDGETKR